MTENRLEKLDSHFKFGENWGKFQELISETRLSDAVKSLDRLLSADTLKNKTMLDVGCGSGLSMLSALKLGARLVSGIDLDPESVNATKALFRRFSDVGSWKVEQFSVFDLKFNTQASKFDVIYSWGVLHHTGDMWRALGLLAEGVSSNGVLCFSLYRKTPLCMFWRYEKKIYAASPRWVQKVFRGIFKSFLLLGVLAVGENPRTYVKRYKQTRGMDWHHDVHDWLGGYPYESATPSEIKSFLNARGFLIEKSFTKSATMFGLFGSHCDEYIARKQDRSCVE